MRQGFTVIELLIVVGIVAILAAIAIPSYIHYSNSAKVSEAVSHLGHIKLRQESYKSEFFNYMSAAPNPSEIPTEPVPWDRSFDAWPWLGFNPKYVRFQYTILSGIPGTVPEYYGPMGWIRRSDRGREMGGYPMGSCRLGFSGNDHWFVLQARADLDDDGDILLVETYSEGTNIYISSPRGWE